ncbi:MAG: metallophosphoesterase [Anaerolineae bacterium]
MSVTGELGALLLGGLAAGASLSLLVRSRRRATAMAAQPTQEAARSFGAAVLVAALFFLADWFLLWSLPHLGLSFSPDIGPPLVASFLIRLFFLGTLVVSLLIAGQPQSFRLWGSILRPGAGSRRVANAQKPRYRPKLSRPGPGVILIFLTLNLAFSGAQAYAFGVEPLWVETSHLTLTSMALDPAAPPVRVVHLTDLHIERSSYREAAIVRRVNELRPDLIVLTGDYLNVSTLFDPTAVADLRRLVGQLEAPYGIYAVRGSVESRPERMAHLWEGTGVVWLEQEALTMEVRGQPLTLVGVACSHNHDRDVARLSEALAGTPDDTARLLLYHSPDLVYEAAEAGIDFYLAGHTHGGQLCLPFYGPLVTFSRYGRQYAAGRFEVEGTTLYVSRGLGFEGGGAPRARFLARPEIVVVDLQAAANE